LEGTWRWGCQDLDLTDRCSQIVTKIEDVVEYAEIADTFVEFVLVHFGVGSALKFGMRLVIGQRRTEKSTSF
jgi:hypothetical protein